MIHDMTARIVRVTKRSLHDEDDPLRAHENLTPSERVALVWELTLQAWAIQGRGDAEPRLARHIVRVYRRGR